MKILAPTCALSTWPLLMGFSSDTTFDLEADLGGGGGYSYTGSPANHGMGCDQCHQGSVGGFTVALSSDPEGLFSTGYEPGQTYQIMVRLVGERHGLDRQGACAPLSGGCNRNAFVAEITDPAGSPRGVLCPAGFAMNADSSCSDESGNGTTLIANRHAIGGQSLAPPMDCAAAGAVPGECVDVAGLRAAGQTESEINLAFSAAVRGSTSWVREWRAPGAGNGSMHLWLGMVDGNGGTTIDPAYNDYAGDAVVMLHQEIAPAGSGTSTRPGCAGGGAGGAGWWLGLLGAVGVAWRRRGRA